MTSETQLHCPKCDAATEVQLVDRQNSSVTLGFDSVVRATNEEVVLEIACKSEECNNVWRAVYAFVGNQ